MRRSAFAAIVLTALLIAPAAAQAPDAKTEILTTIADFMRGLKNQDAALMTAQIDSVTRFTLIRPGPNGNRVIAMAGMDFVAGVSRPGQPAVDEPIRNQVVQIDGDVAAVWAEYQVRSGGKVSHCGYDGFQLAKLGGKWKIINLIDSYRPEGCGTIWP